MSYIGNTPGVSSQRVVLEEVITGSPKSAFVPISGYIKGYVDVLINGVEIDTADFTAADGVTVTLGTAAAVGDTVKIKTWLPRGLSDGYLKSEADARFLQYYNGKAGVGTTTPQKLFVVSNGGANGIEISPDDASTSGLNRMLSYNRTSGAYTPMVFQGSEYRIYTKGASADEVVRVDNAGVVQLLQGQLKFPAAQNASSDANTLDDYEEGTWTPIITGSGGNPTVTYTTQRGNYVKVGRLVFASFYISISSFSGGSGRGGVGGLPFVASSIGAGAPDDNGGSIQEHNAMLSYPAGRTWVTMYVVNGGTNAPLAANGSGIGGADMTIGTNLVSTSGGYILGAVTYTSA